MLSPSVWEVIGDSGASVPGSILTEDWQSLRRTWLSWTLQRTLKAWVDCFASVY